MSAERRQVSVLFSDIVGSTALSTELDPEDLMGVLLRYERICEAAVRDAGGSIVDFQGDGALAVFGYPTTHEDEALRAVRAGLRLLEDLTDSLPAVQARVAIHTGLAVVGTWPGTDPPVIKLVGDPPNIASRLQHVAEPGTLVVSAETLQLVRESVQAEALGAQTVRGIDQPIEVYRISGADAWREPARVPRRPEGHRLMGRDPELLELRELWSAAASGEGAVVLVGGEAGIGKSALVETLIDDVAARGGSWALRGRCSPYTTNTPLSPVIDLVETQILRSQNPEIRRRRLRESLNVAGVPLDESLPLVAPLFGMSAETEEGHSPEEFHRRLLSVTVRLLTVQAIRQPMLVVFEDLHWADHSTLELLDRLLDEVGSARLLVVGTHRPEFRPPWPPQPHLVEMNLTHVDDAAGREIITALTGRAVISNSTISEVLARAEGVPLFIEELARVAAERGDQPPTVPPNLHDSLMSRLDRLGEAKRIAQFASVVSVNKEFRLEDVATLAAIDARMVAESLQALVDAEILYAADDEGGSVYAFRHSLIRDAAYGSLLRSERRSWHGRFADALQGKSDPPAASEVLAHHRWAADEHERAVSHWRDAAESAKSRGALGDAAGHLHRAATVAEDSGVLTPRSEAELHLLIGDVAAAAAGYGAEAAERALERAMELAAAPGDADVRLRALFGLNSGYMSRGDQRRALQSSTRLLAESTQLGDRTLRVQALNALGTASLLSGNLDAARLHLEEGLSLHRPAEDPSTELWWDDQEAANACMLSLALTWQGHHGESDRVRIIADTAADRSAHPLTRALTLGAFGVIDMVRRDGHRLTTVAETLLATVQRYQLPWWNVWGRIFTGWAAFQRGDTTGLAAMGDALDAGVTIQAGSMRPFFLAQYAELLVETGRQPEALAIVSDGLTLVDELGEGLAESELWRVRGIARGSQEDLIHAVKLATEQGAATLALRAATDLADPRWTGAHAHRSSGLLSSCLASFAEDDRSPAVAQARVIAHRVSSPPDAEGPALVTE